MDAGEELVDDTPCSLVDTGAVVVNPISVVNPTSVVDSGGSTVVNVVVLPDATLFTGGMPVPVLVPSGPPDVVLIPGSSVLTACEVVLGGPVSSGLVVDIASGSSVFTTSEVVVTPGPSVLKISVSSGPEVVITPVSSASEVKVTPGSVNTSVVDSVP